MVEVREIKDMGELMSKATKEYMSVLLVTLLTHDFVFWSLLIISPSSLSTLVK